MITLIWRIWSRCPGSRSVRVTARRRRREADAQRADRHAVLLGRAGHAGERQRRRRRRAPAARRAAIAAAAASLTTGPSGTPSRSNFTSLA